MENSIHTFLDRIADVYPDEYIEQAAEGITPEALSEASLKRKVAELVTFIVLDRFDRRSSASANLARMERGLAEAKALLEVMRWEAEHLEGLAEQGEDGHA